VEMIARSVLPDGQSHEDDVTGPLRRGQPGRARPGRKLRLERYLRGETAPGPCSV
jgi:hypothetical protein